MKIKKAYYILEVDNKELFDMIEGISIYLLKNYSADLTNDQLYEIVLSYNMTRKGTREMYKLLEFIIGTKLNALNDNPELLKKIYIIYRDSGLCSEHFLDTLSKLVK